MKFRFEVQDDVLVSAVPCRVKCELEGDEDGALWFEVEQIDARAELREPVTLGVWEAPSLVPAGVMPQLFEMFLEELAMAFVLESSETLVSLFAEYPEHAAR